MEDVCLKTEVHVHVHDQRNTSSKLCFAFFVLINFPSSDPAMEHVVNKTSDQHTSKKMSIGQQVLSSLKVQFFSWV